MNVERYLHSLTGARDQAAKLARLQAILREEAERELGADFDQRPFHDAILALGPVPLPVLEQEMRDFIASRKQARSAARD